jgi:hypothetical protein
MERKLDFIINNGDMITTPGNKKEWANFWALSKPITDDPSAVNPGAGDWFVLIDATEIGAVPTAMLRFGGNIALKPLIISSGVYRLMWDVSKSDIGG